MYGLNNIKIEYVEVPKDKPIKEVEFSSTGNMDVKICKSYSNNRISIKLCPSNNDSVIASFDKNDLSDLINILQNFRDQM